ncbi:hypothetical protein SNS2_4713 [Streptomyces netropsis]|uniref:Uncharacterized protein n=1 Tax=Streptomyces syringium TaxID=76729 RepID=A0ABS4Y020_9ACTN|nr:hypothetical protein [Streptomyces syringium]MBP2401293.1 hypothetical protein [Streptomyces syringium]SPE63211.1 hypothetical protein SNS2_4713 [Streptomyces netropsis]
MGATRGTSLFVVGAVLGSLALGTAGGTAAATARSAAPGTVDTAASAPSADELRKAAGEALRAMDEDSTLQEAAETVRRCSAAGLPEEPGGDCAETRQHHDSLLRARADLEKQAAEQAPDHAAITRAAELADAARNELLARQAGNGPEDGTRDGNRDGAADGVGGLLALVTSVVSGLLGTATGLLGSVTGLLTGLVSSLPG